MTKHLLPSPPRSRRGRRRAGRGIPIAVTMAGLIGAVLTPLAAVAAPPYATEATITSMAFTESVVESGTTTELTGTWSLPDNPETPAGFVIDLPEDLQGKPDTFPLRDGAGALMGTCVTTKTQLVCDFDAEYLESHPIGLTGGFSFGATVTTEVTKQTTVTYDFGDVTATTDVTPGAEACTENCTFPGRPNYKTGEYDNETDTILWKVVVAAGPQGMKGGEKVVVTDALGPNQALVTDSAGKRYPVLWATNELVTQPNGEVVPGAFGQVPVDEYTISADGTTVEFTAKEGYFYDVHYLSRVTDGGAAKTYTNDAEVRIGTEVSTTVTSQVTKYGGAGTGGGTTVGRFAITKALRGDSANLDGLVYRGTYTVTTPAGATVPGEFSLRAGETWSSPAFPDGSRVELSESLAGLPANLDWAAPAFSSSSIEIAGGSTVDVALTNTATLRTKAFSAVKTLAGSAAAVREVPSDAQFVIEYSYPAGPGFPAGSGELVLRAGVPVSAPAVPVGAEITVREREPQSIDGLRWGAPEISPSRFTVGEETVTVSVKNPVTTTTPPPARGTGLASTGGQGTTGALVGAAALLVAGAGLLLARRLGRSRG
ncbi:DUF5979 domain-containing protein [Microbacterium sp. CH1]|uniref:DUF5979 domain-containing protein n=1 Tax=Microbacterium sp. CH1 TaxID=1770208 RepID=UPI0009EED8E9|nr:DUF5979 domain-containing protein [Microbacterium sp. CH1]